MALVDLWPGLRELSVIHVEAPSVSESDPKLFTIKLFGDEFSANIYFKQDQLRALREQITQALGESPQDDSQLEEAMSALQEARSALLTLECAIRPDCHVETKIVE